ncbi:MAG: DEAD/DEAH box helicase [Candidatus Heimdallarchaeota archaeon]|nr:DEAD/DEAH box helicase [Candidatus Heimdallarchaeota archaeon]
MTRANNTPNETDASTSAGAPRDTATRDTTTRNTTSQKVARNSADQKATPRDTTSQKITRDSADQDPPSPPPLTFVCELPQKSNTVSTHNWSASALGLPTIGSIIEQRFPFHPYEFQAMAISELMNGSDLLITSGTGSGKSEIFLLAVLELLLQEEISCVLLIYPSKQLVQDQEARVKKYLSWVKEELGSVITYSSYTGDLSHKAVDGIERACPDILLCTFDKLFYRIMYHSSLMTDEPNADRNHCRQRFFQHIIHAGAVIFDEIHDYSGLTLSNIYNFIHLHKRKNPHSRVVLSSATLSETEDFRDAFLPSARIISGEPRRGRIQILATEKDNLEQLVTYLRANFLSQEQGQTQEPPPAQEQSPVQAQPTTQAQELSRENEAARTPRIILFNDNISQNESFTYLVKNKLAATTGLPVSSITPQASKIACIHSQLPPERKRMIVQKTQDNQLSFLVSTAVLAQGVDFPDFYSGIQVGWPINGLVGALQRIGRIRFDDDLTEVRYFFFILDPEREPDGFFLAHPKQLAERLLKAKVPSLLFNTVNFRLAQGLLLLGTAYGLLDLSALRTIFTQALAIPKAQENAAKLLRQALTSLISKGILAITDNQLSLGSPTELSTFLRGYHLRAILPKWTVKDSEQKQGLFTVDSRKILREALPGNILLNDGVFWQVEDLNHPLKEITVSRLDPKTSPDLSQKKPNKCQSPEITFDRFARELLLPPIKITYGDLTVIRRPSTITRYHPLHGFTQVEVDDQFFQQSNKAKYSFIEKSAGLTIGFQKKFFPKILGSLAYRRYYFLRLILHVFLLEVTRTLTVPRKELRSSVCWEKGKEAIAIYDLAGPSGNSHKIFLASKKLLRTIHSRLDNCPCLKGCSNCYPKLDNIFEVNPKVFLLKFLKEVGV